MSAHTLAVIAICTGFLAGMALVFRFLCPDEPRDQEDIDRERDSGPLDMLAAA